MHRPLTETNLRRSASTSRWLLSTADDQRCQLWKSAKALHRLDLYRARAQRSRLHVDDDDDDSLILSPCHPILSSRNGFDFHVYFMPTNPVHVRHVLQLHQRISSEFPELPIYCVSDGPKGPHPTATFKVLTNTLIRLALFLAGSSSIEDPLSDTYRDHAELASWIGQPWPLNLEVLKGHGTE
ncbi:hypothetical protein EV401DRAFT_1001051 [Pisolithus croceorrhizus]|nr:hypothetical protein EV401DRAFT_1001051 [Pisolithus croceorrhizus]